MTTFRVITFNINGMMGDENGANTWEQRAPLNVNLIQKYTPDIIGFQEFTQGNIDTYTEHLPQYRHVLGGAYGGGEEWPAIFWNAARFDLLHSGYFWLTRTPNEPKPDWGIDYPLAATWVRLRNLESGAELIHLNTHYEDAPWGETMRVEGTKIILAQLEQVAPGLPAVITGDFNCDPKSAAYSLYRENGFVDAYAGQPDDTTFHGFLGAAYDGREWGGAAWFWRVDWILARGLQVRSCQIVKDAQPPLYPSDHYPVIAELRIGKNSEHSRD